MSLILIHNPAKKVGVIQEAICIIMMIGISLGPFILCHCISVLLCVLVRAIKFNVNNRKKTMFYSSMNMTIFFILWLMRRILR